MQDAEHKKLRKAFSDICRGYSVAELDGTRVYIKHVDHHDQVNFDILYDSYFEDAVSQSVPKHEDKIKFLQEQGVWDPEKEEEIKSLTEQIERMNQQKKHIILVSKLKSLNDKIDEKRSRLQEILEEKVSLIGVTAESFAEKRVNEFYIFDSFYKDADCRQRLYTEKEFEELEESDIQKLIYLYNRTTEYTGDRQIKMLAIQDFFMGYWSLVVDGNFDGFFGKPICNFTFNQIKLATYGSIFKDILSRAESLPEDIKKDPDKILDYVNATERGKEQIGKSSKDGGGMGIVGATKEDYIALGIEERDMVDLRKEMEKSGKKELSMEEMMKLSGL